MKKYILLFLLFSCEEPSVFSPSAGCMNENACNYDEDAMEDDDEADEEHNAALRRGIQQSEYV